MFLLLGFLSDNDTLHLGKSYSSTEIQHMYDPCYPRSLPYPNKQSPPHFLQTKLSLFQITVHTLLGVTVSFCTIVYHTSQHLPICPPQHTCTQSNAP